MDVLTPSSSSTPSLLFASLVRSVQDKRDAYEHARRALRSEKMRRWEMDKEALKAERKRNVRWTKKGSGWSSAVEPNLSPIAGSSAATTPRDESTGTVVRTSRPGSGEQSRNGKDGVCGTVMETISTSLPGTTPSDSSISDTTSGITRKPMPSGAHIPEFHANIPPRSSITESSIRHHIRSRPYSANLGHWGSHSDLIPVESEYPQDSPPKVGPKPVS